MCRAVTEGVRIDTVHMLVELQSSCPKVRINEIAKKLDHQAATWRQPPWPSTLDSVRRPGGFRGIVLLGTLFFRVMNQHPRNCQRPVF